MAESEEFTREIGSCYLIGDFLNQFSEETLPSNKDVLCRFFYHRETEQKSFSESLNECAIELTKMWHSARIPIKNFYRIQNQINGLHMKWVKVKKNKSRGSIIPNKNERPNGQQVKEEKFSKFLETLFDVSHNGCLKCMKDDDKELLGITGNVVRADDKLNERMEYWQRLAEVDDSVVLNNESEETVAENNDFKTESVTVVQNNDLPENNNDFDTENVSFYDDGFDAEWVSIANDCEIENNFDADFDEDYVPPNKYRKKITKKKEVIMTPQLSGALDRINASNRGAVILIAAAAIAMKRNPENMVLNRESFRQSRETHRQQKAIQIRNDFNPTSPLVIHWDGCLMPNAQLNINVDRIAVVVTGDGISQTLEVPYLLEATGLNHAKLVYEQFEKWNITDKIRFMSFDTTSVNSGRIKGACIELQKLVSQRLFWLACRHHIMEIIVAAVYKTALRDVSTGPNIALFLRFRNKWNEIDKNKYESCQQDKEIIDHIIPIKDYLITFVNDQLRNFPQTRDDYKELLMLTLLFLGEKPPKYKIGKIKEYVIHTCGALHRARWMARLIYSFKIYLFQSQFELSTVELSGIKQFLVFVVSVYIKNWYQAPCTLTAATNDLKLLKDIDQYKAINSDISDAAMDKLSKHLWYLSEELAGIALFDNSLELSEKTSILKAIKNQGCKNPQRRVKVDTSKVTELKVSNFITSNSLAIFEALNISQEFLDSDPKTWPDREDYKEGQNKLKKLNVVNDAAERRIALAKTYNGHITKDEQQWQYLLLGVEHHQKIVPNANKKTVLNGLK